MWFVAGGGSGDGFPPPSSRGQALRGGTGMGPRIREDNGWWEMGSRIRLHGGKLCAGGRGWVPASARTTEVGMGSRIRFHGGRLFVRKQRRRGWGWVPASVFTGAGSRWEDTGGCTPILTFPPEGGRERGGGGPSVLRRWALRGNDVDGRERGKGWVPAYARTTGWEREEGGWAGGVAGGGWDGFSPPSSREQRDAARK